MKEINHNDEYFYFTKSSIYELFELEHFDSENYNGQSVQNSIERLFTDSSYEFEFISDCTPFDDKQIVGSRGLYADTIPVSCQRLFLVVSKNLNLKDLFITNIQSIIKNFKKDLDLGLLESDFNAKNIKISDLPYNFRNFDVVSASNPVLDTEVGNISLFKIKDLSTNAIFIDVWSYLKESMGRDYSIKTVIKPYSKQKSEATLRRLSRKRDSENDLTGAIKKRDTEDSLSNVTLSGEVLCELDVTVCYRSHLSREDHLKRALKIKRDLSYLADFSLETLGAKSVLKKLKVGTYERFYLNEVSSKIIPYLPIFTSGDSTAKTVDESSLYLQRGDNSLSKFEYFNKKNSSHNFLVIGQTGTGKSILTGLLLDNLTKNPNCSIQVLDVGSSHINTVKCLGGRVKSFDLAHSSGINPFKMVTDKSGVSVEEKTSILSDFICNLILETEETSIKRELQASIENETKVFVEEFSKYTDEVTINDFLSFSSDFPRKKLLARYGSKGLYKNAFQPVEDSKSANLEYYDFKEIAQAQDPSFSKAAMSALITCFNFSVLTDKKRKKLLIIDECPIFIKENYAFLCSIASNIRKYGGSICIIAQTTDQVCPEGDTKLVSQLKNKLLYSVDSTEEKYKERLQVSDDVYERIKNLKSETKVANEVIYTNGDFSKTYLIRLTPGEYYKLTSNDDDKRTINKLVEGEFVKNKEEAIKFLEWRENEKGIGVRLEL